MAPAAYDTISAHFQDTGRTPSSYDLIITGDLGTWAASCCWSCCAGTEFRCQTTPTAAH